MISTIDSAPMWLNKLPVCYVPELLIKTNATHLSTWTNSINTKDSFAWSNTLLKSKLRQVLLHGSYTSVFEFLKTQSKLTLKTPDKKTKLNTRYLFTKKALFRDMQKKFVRTNFLRFFNLRVNALDFYLSKQIVTKYMLTREDNWFPYVKSSSSNVALKNTC